MRDGLGLGITDSRGTPPDVSTRVGALILPYVVPESIPSDEGKAFCMMRHRETPSSSEQSLQTFQDWPCGAANATCVTSGSVGTPMRLLCDRALNPHRRARRRPLRRLVLRVSELLHSRTGRGAEDSIQVVLAGVLQYHVRRDMSRVEMTGTWAFNNKVDQLM